MTELLIVALVLPWALLALQSWLLYQLFRQQGRLLLSLDDVHDRIDQLELGGEEADVELPSLPIGSVAPEFALPDLSGNERRLSDFLGEPLLVTFFDLGCGYCRQMMPALGELPDDSPRVLLVSRGDADEHRRLAEEHGWRCDIVLDVNREVAKTWQFGGTPTGYLVSADGRIASNLGIGADAVLSLARSAAASPNGHRHDAGEGSADGHSADGARRRVGLATRDLSESRLNRKGLRAGTPAPEFTLPDLDGAERSLTDFHGKPVLLVFSDVDCVPCDALAPKLRSLHEQRRDELEIVMVSRGSREANRQKAEEHGFEFPVVRQRAWEVSKRYGSFATPVGYLIDEHGVIASDLASGAEAILTLVERQLAAEVGPAGADS